MPSGKPTTIRSNGPACRALAPSVATELQWAPRRLCVRTFRPLCRLAAITCHSFARSHRMSSTFLTISQSPDNEGLVDGSPRSFTDVPSASALRRAAQSASAAAAEQSTALQIDFYSCEHLPPYPTGGCGWIRASRLWPSRGSAAGLVRNNGLRGGRRELPKWRRPCPVSG